MSRRLIRDFLVKINIINMFFPYTISKEKLEEKMKKAFGFLIGLFVGWLVGATAALLLAPESGENLRTKIRDRSATFSDEVRKAVNDRRHQLEEQIRGFSSTNVE